MNGASTARVCWTQSHDAFLIGAFMTLPTRAILGLAMLGTMTASPGSTQSLQKISLQGSGAILFATRQDPNYDSRRRLGWEAQARYTFARFSLGAGYQRSTVFAFTEGPLTLALSFAFVEPRMVVLARRGVAFYLAGRVGAGKLVCSNPDECTPQSTNVGYGGGGGLLFRLTSRISADLGGQYFDVRGDLPSGYAMIRAGIGVGL